MELKATSISTLIYQYCHCTGKIPRKLPLIEFPSSEHIVWQKTRVQFLQREEKRVKGTNVTKMQKNYTKNENFLTIFFIEGTLMRASRRPTIRPAHICC